MFDYFVSLGHYCGVAMSMEKYGLRSYSGPFDWYLSNFSGVIRTIEEEFQNFLQYENLQPFAGQEHLFRDTVYDFHFVHEMEEHEELSVKYPAIHEKYLRRISVFANMLQKPTCCIRTVQNEDEIIFINENEDKIRFLFKKYNPQNEVIFLLPDRLKTATVPFLSFCLATNFDDLRVEALRGIFDLNPKFIRWCRHHSDRRVRIKNQRFYQSREAHPL